MTTHTVTKGTMSNLTTAIIPNPELLDLVKKHLPGEAGIGVMYSITGGLSFRAARLAGMIANGLAADIRNDPTRDAIDTYNDAMSYLDEMSAAEQWFNNAGGVRQDMTRNLCDLLHYYRTCTDYLATLVGEDRLPVKNWADILRQVGEPAPIEKWKLDYEWKEYTESGDADPQMTRDEYDLLTTRELQGQRATWLKHISAVENIIALADAGATIEFHQLDKQTQFSLLMSYATPERMAKFRTSVMKRARTRFGADADIRMHKAFVEACRLASTHHRYANLGDKLTPSVQPASPSAKQIAVQIKARNDKGVYAEYIDQAVDAEKRAAAANKLAIKRERKAKPAPKVVKDLGEIKSLVDQPNDI